MEPLLVGPIECHGLIVNRPEPRDIRRSTNGRPTRRPIFWPACAPIGSSSSTFRASFRAAAVLPRAARGAIGRPTDGHRGDRA